MTPRVRSVNVARAEELRFDGRVVTSAIRKRPVQGRVQVRPLGLEGDEQADLKVHGGLEQAVYVYPYEHYADWERELGHAVTQPSFGENLVVQGLLETEVELGDRLRIGSSYFEVTRPRFPCYKLQVLWGRKDMTRIFARAPRPGFYLRVLEEGDIGPGDSIEWERRGSGTTVLAAYDERLGKARSS